MQHPKGNTNNFASSSTILLPILLRNLGASEVGKSGVSSLGRNVSFFAKCVRKGSFAMSIPGASVCLPDGTADIGIVCLEATEWSWPDTRIVNFDEIEGSGSTDTGIVSLDATESLGSTEYRCSSSPWSASVFATERCLPNSPELNAELVALMTGNGPSTSESRGDPIGRVAAEVMEWVDALGARSGTVPAGSRDCRGDCAEPGFPLCSSGDA
jgi:hypothetical protein